MGNLAHHFQKDNAEEGKMYLGHEWTRPQSRQKELNADEWKLQQLEK